MLRGGVKLQRARAIGTSAKAGQASNTKWRSAAIMMLLPCAANAANPTDTANAPRYAEVNFDSRFLFGNTVDLARFSRGNAVLPGVYASDVKVNGKREGRFDIRFMQVDGAGQTEPCFTRGQLDAFGIDLVRVQAARLGYAPGAAQAQAAAFQDDSECLALSVAVPGATAYMDLGELTLELSVPQAFMTTRARGWVDPSRWNDGATVGLLDYTLNGYTSRMHDSGSGDFNNLYLGLTSGLNLGPWRLRQRSTKSWSNRGRSSWNSLETYAQRGISPWRSQLVLGDSNTSGEFFDTSSLRGVRMFSDDRMIPDSMRSYAPVVRGIADTNAIVTVRQGGRVVYEENVPAGPFELSDLPASGYGGDLNVTVQEADGRQSTFTVPFASVPLLLRDGLQRYSLGVGKYRNSEFDSEPWMLEGTYQYGLTDAVTAYAGTQASDGYASLMLGSALNTPVGAFSLDVTGARTQVDGRSNVGTSTRLTYANILSDMGTRFSMAGYRYSTSNFYSLRDAIYARAGTDETQSVWTDYRVRERFQVNVSQPVGDRGNVFITGSRQNYWREDSGSDLQFQVGYSSSYRTLTYAVYAQRIRTGQSAALSNQVMLTLSIPLGRGGTEPGARFNSLSSNISRGSDGSHLVQATASGTGGPDLPVSFGVNASTSQSGGSSSSTNTLGGYGSYRAPYGNYTANASVSNRGRQLSLGARGAVVAHEGGVTAGPSLGRASALVQAKGAAGARLINGQGAHIDSNGYALVSSLTPYRINNVMLDPSKLGLDVDLESTSEEIVPTLDSVVFVEMRTTQGKPVLMRLKNDKGEALPLGANVFQDKGEQALGTVGQGGAALVRGLADQGVVLVRWGDAPDQQCQAAYRLPEPAPAKAPAGGEAKAPANKLGTVRVQVACLPLDAVAQTAAAEPSRENAGE